MCLSEIWTDEQMEEWLAGQGEVIEVWKTTEISTQRAKVFVAYIYTKMALLFVVVLI